MSLPAILPTAFGAALGPPYGGIGAKLTLLTEASGLWKPHPKTGRVFIIATGPGGTGVANNYSGGSGGTAIKMVDLTQYSGDAIAYTVGQRASGLPTTILGLTGGAAAGFNPGNASGGDMNLSGGVGSYLPASDVSVTVNGISITIGGGAASVGGVFTGTFNTVTSADGSLSFGSAPGAPSYWGGCNAIGGASSVYGTGGPANASTGYAGGPGVIYILGDLSDG